MRAIRSCLSGSRLGSLPAAPGETRRRLPGARVDAAACIGFAAPAVLVFWTVVDQEQQPGCGQALHQAVQQRLRLGINPVQILEDQAQRLHLAFAQQQALDGLQRALAALRGIERLPLLIVDWHLQQRQQGRASAPGRGRASVACP